MPQLYNDDIISRIIISVINVIRRRTSEDFAIIIINKVIKKLRDRYTLFNYIEVKNASYSKVNEIIDIKPDVNQVNINEIGKAFREFFERITSFIGIDAGYYFIKEVEEDLPYDYQLKIKDLGIDLNLMQLEYITDKKKTHMIQIENSELLKNVLNTLFNILDKEVGRNFAITNVRDLLIKHGLDYEFLKHVKINDVRFIQGADTVSLASNADYTKSEELGIAIQKIIQELDDLLKEKCGFSIIEKLRNNLSKKYVFKLEELGINLYDIQLQQDFVVKHVLKALIDVLSEFSTQSYAVLVIDKVLRRIDEEYDYLKYITINSNKYSDGFNAVNVFSDINSIDPYELGRGIQKFIEKMAVNFGEEAGKHFIDKFKEHLGKICLNRIEEMGVNLHIIQLRQDLLW